MKKMRVKWGLVLKALAITVPIVGAKVAFHYLGWEGLGIGTLTSALVTGVFFVIAIILAGVLTDFKESEKMLGEFASSVENIYKDSRLIGSGAEVAGLLSHERDLVHAATGNFRLPKNEKTADLSPLIDTIEADVRSFNQQNKSLSVVTRMRTDLANLKRIASRIETIKDTTFLTPAHAIAQVGVAGIVAVLLITKLDPFYEGLLLMGVLSLVLISVVLLINDMDDPFTGYATVDLGVIYKLENYLDGMQP
jgi:hypothetical protein